MRLSVQLTQENQLTEVPLVASGVSCSKPMESEGPASIDGICLYHRHLLLKLHTQSRSHLVVEVCIQQGI